MSSIKHIKLDKKNKLMKLDKDYKKVIGELHKNYGWSGLDELPEAYQYLLNDVIIASRKIILKMQK